MVLEHRLFGREGSCLLRPVDVVAKLYALSLPHYCAALVGNRPGACPHAMRDPGFPATLTFLTKLHDVTKLNKLNLETPFTLLPLGLPSILGIFASDMPRTNELLK